MKLIEFSKRDAKSSKPPSINIDVDKIVLHTRHEVHFCDNYGFPFFNNWLLWYQEYPFSNNTHIHVRLTTNHMLEMKDCKYTDHI